MLEHVTVPFHSCVRLDGSQTVYVDPYGLRQASHDADIILITHSHYDHLSLDDIDLVKKPDTDLVLPQSEVSQTKKLGFPSQQIHTLAAGKETEIKGVHIEAVEAYNKLKPFHPRSKGWIGYIITLDGTRYYVAGDTDNTPEAQKVSCDVALVPVGGTYTMNAKAAADLVNTIRPQAAVPIHYGSVVGDQTDAETFLAKLDSGIYGELKLRT